MEYYTPNNKDFKVGFYLEYSHQNPKVDGGMTWYTRRLIAQDFECQTDSWGEQTSFMDFIMYLYRKGGVRVPHITVDQVKEDGWTTDPNSISEKITILERGNYWAVLDLRNFPASLKVLSIKPDADPYKSSIRYWGPCPSINEFRDIVKLLHI